MMKFIIEILVTYAFIDLYVMCCMAIHKAIRSK